MKIEECAYHRLNIECDKLKNCDGFNDKCYKYVTFSHMKEFYEKFGVHDIYDERIIKVIENDK